MGSEGLVVGEGEKVLMEVWMGGVNGGVHETRYGQVRTRRLVGETMEPAERIGL